jgi:hypothetical protein
MPNADDAEHGAAAALLDNLFGDPRRQRSVSNARYFDRYFSYTTNPDDITDSELDRLLELCRGENEEQAVIHLNDLAKRNTPVLMGRLRAFAGRLGRETTERLTRMLARNAGLFETVKNSSLWIWWREPDAATLIAELILTCSGTTEQRGALVV